MADIKRLTKLTLLVLASSALMAGCATQSASGSSTASNRIPASSSKKQSKKPAFNYAVSKADASKSRASFLAKMKTYHAKTVTFSDAVVNDPKNVKQAAEDVALTFQGVVTKVTPIPTEGIALSLCTITIGKVFAGDQSMVGKQIELQVDGGLIQNKELYANYQQKTYIPAKDKLTPQQLEEFTYVKPGGFDLAAPGDEIVAMAQPNFAKHLNRQIYIYITPVWVFYRTQGTDKFVIHDPEGKGIGGNGAPGGQPAGDSAPSNSLTSESDRQTPEQIVNDINKMVETGKIPTS